MHLPCQVQAPQQNHQLQCQVGHKERVVAFTHTVLHPGTMVIIATNTAAALTAVSGTQGLLWVQRAVEVQHCLSSGERAEGCSQIPHVGGIPAGEAGLRCRGTKAGIELGPIPPQELVCLTYQHQAVSAAPKWDSLRNHGCLFLLGLLLKMRKGYEIGGGGISFLQRQMIPGAFLLGFTWFQLCRTWGPSHVEGSMHMGVSWTLGGFCKTTVLTRVLVRSSL